MRFPLECVHLIDFQGRCFAFDGNAILLAEVDGSLREALELGMKLASREEVERVLAERHGGEHARGAMRSLEQMAGAGFFAPVDEERILDIARASKREGTGGAAVSGLQLLATTVCNLRCT
jgi:hypothetical protein